LDILVIDDGSDFTCRRHFVACETAGAQVIRLPVNRGKGHALGSGFIQLQGACGNGAVVTADADGQHAVADILAVGGAVDTSMDAEAPGSGGSVGSTSTSHCGAVSATR
jgi:hypothetical protein